jgi:hypothetical protein
MLQRLNNDVSMEVARATVSERFKPELAEKILRAGDKDYVEYVAYEWGESGEGPRDVEPPGPKPSIGAA